MQTHPILLSRQLGLSLRLLALIVVAPVVSVQANPTAPLDLMAMSLEELGTVKVTEVYAASKQVQDIGDAPASVTVVTRAEIQQQGHRTLADILNGVRGFYVSHDRGYSYIGMRGFNRLKDYGGRILLLVDGHRLNDGIYDSTVSGAEFLLDVDLIERVEIVRGPGASLYGNNTVFGVINIITRSGGGIDGTEVSGAYGRYDAWNGRATFGAEFANGLEWLWSISWLERAGPDRLTFPEYVAEGLDAERAPSTFAKLTYGDFTLQGGLVQRRKYWPGAAYDTVPNEQRVKFYTDDDRAYLELKYEHEFNSGWRVAARSYWDYYLYRGRYPYDYDADPITFPDRNWDRARSQAGGLELTGSKKLSAQHRVTLGAEFQNDFELLQKNWDSAPYNLLLDSSETAHRTGLYLQDEWLVRTNVIFNLGARYDYYSIGNQTISPRAALIHHFRPSTTFKALYGQAFRTPNAYELYYSGFGTKASFGLKPEKNRSAELLWEQSYGPRWRSSVGGFWNEIDDLISQELDPGDGLLFFNNLDSATAWGWEAELEGRWESGLRVLGQYTFTQSEDQATGWQLENSPRHLAKFSLTIPLWKQKLLASTEVQAMSSRRTAAGNQTPGFAIANFTLFSRELRPGLEVSASIYNVFDKHYSHPVSTDFYYTGPISGAPIELDSLPQDGRTFRLKVTYRF